MDPLSEGPPFLSSYHKPHPYSFGLTACQPTPGRSRTHQPVASLQFPTSGHLVCQAFQGAVASLRKSNTSGHSGQEESESLSSEAHRQFTL